MYMNRASHCNSSYAFYELVMINRNSCAAILISDNLSPTRYGNSLEIASGDNFSHNVNDHVKVELLAE